MTEKVLALLLTCYSVVSTISCAEHNNIDSDWSHRFGIEQNDLFVELCSLDADIQCENENITKKISDTTYNLKRFCKKESIFQKESKVVYLNQVYTFFNDSNMCYNDWEPGQSLFWKGFHSRVHSSSFIFYRDTTTYRLGSLCEYSEASIDGVPFAKILHVKSDHLIVRITYINKGTNKNSFDSVVVDHLRNILLM